MKQKNSIIYLFVFLAMLFWGMSFVWTSILLKYYQPITIIFIRLILSSAFLFLIMIGMKRTERILRKDIPIILFSAVFNPFLYFLGENYGLKFSSPTITSVIIATIPVFTPLAAWFFMRERITWYNFAGILISFIGVLIILVNKQMEFVIDPIGLFFLAGAVISAIIFTVFLKKLSARYSPLTLITFQNFTVIFLFMPFFFIFEFYDFIKVTPTLSILSSFLFLSILASSLSYVFFAKAIKHLGMSKANVFSNLIPVFTAIFSFFILSEQFTLMKICGMVIVIAGVYISEVTFRKGSIKF
jgi:drug/metabolite transporter (DMT)-like permease